MHPAFVGKQSEQLCRSPDQKLVQRALQKWRNAFAARKNVSPMCPAKCASRERSVCGQRDTACMPTSKSDVEVCGTTNRGNFGDSVDIVLEVRDPTGLHQQKSTAVDKPVKAAISGGLRACRGQRRSSINAGYQDGCSLRQQTLDKLPHRRPQRPMITTRHTKKKLSPSPVIEQPDRLQPISRQIRGRDQFRHHPYPHPLAYQPAPRLVVGNLDPHIQRP